MASKSVDMFALAKQKQQPKNGHVLPVNFSGLHNTLLNDLQDILFPTESAPAMVAVPEGATNHDLAAVEPIQIRFARTSSFSRIPASREPRDRSGLGGELFQRAPRRPIGSRGWDPLNLSGPRGLQKPLRHDLPKTVHRGWHLFPIVETRITFGRDIDHEVGRLLKALPLQVVRYLRLHDQKVRCGRPLFVEEYGIA